MDIKKAREYYHLGVVKGFRSHREPMAKGWYLVVDVITAEGLSSTVLETSLGVPKVFASLDTLAGQIQQVSREVREVQFIV